MKVLQNILYESMGDKQLKDYIITYLNTTDVDPEVLEKIKSLLDRSGLDNNMVEDFFRRKGLDDCYEFILSIFSECGDMESISNHIKNPINISSSDLVKHNNIYKLLTPYVKQKTLDKLTNYRPAKNNIARGPYEIILDIFLNDITDKNTGVADVNTTGIGGIELKGPRARIKGSLKPAPYNCTITFNNIMSQRGIDLKVDSLFQNSGFIKSIISKLKGEFGLEESDICSILAKCMLSKYANKSANTKDIEDEMVAILMDNSKELFNNKKTAPAVFYAFLVADMYFYQASENWDYIMIFKGRKLQQSNGNYIMIGKDDVKKGLKSIYNIFQKNGVYTLSSSVHDNDSFSQACTIFVK